MFSRRIGSMETLDRAGASEIRYTAPTYDLIAMVASRDVMHDFSVAAIHIYPSSYC